MPEQQFPVDHAMSWWQYVAGWLGIPSRAWCGAKVVARRRRVSGATRCRECQRALRGER